ILLIVADDLGLDCGCYGNAKVHTPNIDVLAKRGVRFAHAFATVSSCSASRAVLYTGLYTHTNGQLGHAHPPASLQTHDWVKSLPRVLRDTGYRTGIIGKLHVLPPAVYPFDVAQGDAPVGTRDVAKIGELARRFFAESDKPFLLIVGFGDPHRSAKGFGNEHLPVRRGSPVRRGPPAPANRSRQTAGSGDPRRTEDPAQHRRYDPRDVRVPGFLPDLPEVREELAEYYQAVSRLDHGVGLVLAALAQAKRDDNTLVIFLSDNGIPFPGAKTNLYDPGIHLPLIVSSPRQKRHGLVNRAMVSWVDITPTIWDWGGVKAPYPMPGRSLLPILEEANPPGWDVIYGSHVFHEITMYYPMRMLRTRQNKYILNLASKLDFPFASDLYESKTWQGILRRSGGLGRPAPNGMFGPRSIAAYVHRPREELYDLEK